MNTKEILGLCKVEDNKVYLPDIQLDRKQYLDIKKELTSLGGSWKGGKINAFVFNFDPQLLLDKLLNSNKTNIKKTIQFFPTPSHIVDLMLEQIELADDFSILEPSAGQGAIISEIIKQVPNAIIDYCEIEPINVEILKNKFNNINMVGDDFLKLDNTKLYDRIIANPPFAKSQDIIHIRKMFDLLNKNGVLVSVCSTSWFKYKTDKKSTEFKKWLETQDHEIINISSGEFKESGTMIETMILKIKT